MVWVQKWRYFNLFLMQYRPGKCLYDILERENAFLGYKNKKFKKSKNWHFSKGVNPWFWSNNGHFSNSFFVVNIGQGNVFYNIVAQNYAFLGYKNKKIKGRKIDIFQMGLTDGCGPKMAAFPTFFLRQYRPRKCLSLYSRTKKRLSTL